MDDNIKEQIKQSLKTTIFGNWIKADISKQEGIDKVVATFDGKPLDVFLFTNVMLIF